MLRTDLAQPGPDGRLCLVADGARVEEHYIGSVDTRRENVTRIAEQRLDDLGVGDVHLATIRLNVHTPARSVDGGCIHIRRKQLRSRIERPSGARILLQEVTQRRRRRKRRPARGRVSTNNGAESKRTHPSSQSLA